MVRVSSSSPDALGDFAGRQFRPEAGGSVATVTRVPVAEQGHERPGLRGRRARALTSVALPGLLVAIVALMLLPGLFIGPSLDATIFSTVGWRLAAGDALYAEVWEHKPPGVFMPYTVAHLLTDTPGLAWATVWSVTLACIVGAALAVRSLLMQEGASPGAAGIAAALAGVGASSYLVSLGGGMSESFAVLPLAVAVSLACRGHWIASGVAAGTAIAISFQSLPVLAAIAAMGLARDAGLTLRRAARVTGGVLVVAGAVTAGVWLNGGLAEAADALVAYPSAYVAVARRAGGALAWGLLPWTVLVLLPLLLGVGLAIVNRRRLASSRAAAAAAAWILLAIVLIGLQGRFYAHYATPLAIPLSILAGLGIDAARRTLPRRGSTALVGIPFGAALLLSLAVGAVGARDEQEPVRASNRRAEAIAAAVRSRTDPGDAIFVWGNDSRVYELADRPPATRYVYLYPLLTHQYATGGVMEDVLAAFRSARPSVVIDSGSIAEGQPGLPPMLIDRPVATDGRDLDLLDPMRDVITRDYRLAEVVEGWPLYVRSSP